MDGTGDADIFEENSVCEDDELDTVDIDTDISIKNKF